MRWRRLGGVPLASAACLAAAGLAGCGHGSASAAASPAAGDADHAVAEMAELTRVLRSERARGRWDPGPYAGTIIRPIDPGGGDDRPPADVRPLSALSPRDVALSAAMYQEAGRWREQWMLLGEETRRQWVQRLREEARTRGLHAAAGTIDEGHAGWIWSRGVAAGGGVADLAARWEQRISGDRAEISVHRRDRVLQRLHLRRESGRWRLDLPVIAVGDVVD